MHGATYDDSDSDDEGIPLLSKPGALSASRHHCAHPHWLTAVYFCVMAVNGGMIGAFGPSLQMLQRATGLDEAEIGKMVMQNRLSKLAGTLIWCAYAKYLQEEQRCGKSPNRQPHTLLACLMAFTACASAIVGHLVSSAGALQFALVAFGLVYGISDRYTLGTSPVMWGAPAYRKPQSESHRQCTQRWHTVTAWYSEVVAQDRYAHTGRRRGVGGSTGSSFVALLLSCSARTSGGSGVTSLTLWRWAHDSQRRRFDVALLNSGFTVGATASCPRCNCAPFCPSS